MRRPALRRLCSGNQRSSQPWIDPRFFLRSGSTRFGPIMKISAKTRALMSFRPALTQPEYGAFPRDDIADLGHFAVWLLDRVAGAMGTLTWQVSGHPPDHPLFALLAQRTRTAEGRRFLAALVRSLDRDRL